MERNLRTAAFQFRGAFDGEIIRAVNGLRVDAITAQEGAWYRYADRFASWLDTAEHPGIVAAVFLVDESQGQVRVRRWNDTSHAFDEVGWTAELAALRPRFEQELAGFGAPRGERPPFAADDSMVVIPLGNAPPRPGEERDRTPPVFGFTVVQWDMAYIRNEFLPALNESHFRNSDGDRYRVAVIDAQEPSRVVYQSDPSAPVDVANPDASEPLFGAFRDPLNNRGRQGGRGDGRRNFGFRGPGSGVPGSGATVQGSNVPGSERGRGGRDFARWVLVVQHESGSLEAAVSRVRRRNLGISFGVLMLLTVSVGLLTVSSRRAQRLARQQLEFVAGVSHELRTPVAVIRSAAENLAQGVVGSGDRVKQYGQVIETEARRLGDMVERVLQYAGIASGVGLASRTTLSPGDIVDSAVEAATQATPPANIERTIGEDLPPVHGDQAALRSAVENLISNALKYGGADRWVGVRAELGGTKRQREVLITVEDHGSGIPGEELPHIFSAFYRGQNALSGQIQGNGLGLALVKQIVSAHGGRVTVSTRPGAGSAFTIHLPVQS